MAIWTKIFGGDSGHTSDSIQTIKHNLNDGTAVMFDVRGQQERNAGHLKDSIFIPFTDIKDLDPGVSSIPGLPKDKIIYCH